MRSLTPRSTDPEAKRSLFSSPLIRIHEVICQRAQRGLSCEECKTEHSIGITLSGVNVRHVGGRTFTASPSHVMLSNRGEPYRVSHPFGSGEVQLSVVLREDLLIELLAARDPGVRERRERPFRERQVPADPKLRFAVQLLAAAVALRRATVMELEETAIALVERIVTAGAPAPREASMAPRGQELAQRARAALAALYERPIGLEDIAASVGVSIYHLCRVFRRATGATLWAELQQLRVGAALARLAAGERDLTALGLALGYAHHSHFTMAFRRRLGLTPSAARRLLQAGSLSQARRLLAR